MADSDPSRYEQMRDSGSSVLRYAKSFRGQPRTRTLENTRTCTTRQILQSVAQTKVGGRFVLDNGQLYTVRLCGRITRIDQNETATDFTLDDGTGVLQGRIWPLTSSGKTGLSGSTLGAYYVIIANIVTFSDGILLQTLNAEKVINHNQVTLHLLSAIHEHCTAYTLTKQDVQRWDTARDAAKARMSTLTLELNKEAIVSFLSTESIRTSDNGASSKSITSALHMEFDEAWYTLKAMLDEGSVYNTVDYQHFKLADEN